MSRTTKAVRCLLLAMPITLVVCELAMAGKPAPPPSNPTPIEYRLTWLGAANDINAQGLDINALNNSGTAIGGVVYNNPYSHWAIRATEIVGIQALDDLSDSWFDLETDSYVAGWRAAYARSLNELGYIASSAVDANGQNRPLLFKEGMGFVLLPSPQAGPGKPAAYSISEQGDVLVQLAAVSPGQAFLWSPLFPKRLYFVGMNVDSAPAGLSVALPGLHTVNG